YGGNTANRLRFLIQVTHAIARVWPSERIGVRMTPAIDSNGTLDSQPMETFVAAVKAMNRIGVGYLHVVENAPWTPQLSAEPRVAHHMRTAFTGRFILNGGYDAAKAAEALRTGEA